MDSLLASYRRERQREGTSGHSGAGTNEIYHSKWFAFAEMQFLNDKFKPRTTTDTTINPHATHIEQEHEEPHEDVEIVEDHSERYTNDEQPQKEKVFVSPKKTKGLKRKKEQEDPRISETYQIIKEISNKRQTPKVKSDSIIFGDYFASKLELFDQRTRTILQHQISSLICSTEINYIHNNPGNQTLQVNINNQPTANTMSFSSPLSSPSSSSLHSISTIQPQSPYYPSTVQQLYHQETSNFPSIYDYQYQQTPNIHGTSADINASETILSGDLNTTSNI
ncbi:unnamed protein product [Macrosiphum euphorbiae]|nr:unnamed protein product [Macrosiphum euphorbiae]